MLTGKAKEQFEEWYGENYLMANNCDVYDLWNQIPFSMQWGVYLEWADSLEYVIQTPNDCELFGYTIEHLTKEELNKYTMYCSVSRKEAQQSAIEKLNELINK